jgi:hypothetical protein
MSPEEEDFPHNKYFEFVVLINMTLLVRTSSLNFLSAGSRPK